LIWPGKLDNPCRIIASEATWRTVFADSLRQQERNESTSVLEEQQSTIHREVIYAISC